MFDLQTALALVILMVTVVVLGVHIAIALGMVSVLGIFMVTGRWSVVESLVANTALNALRDFNFAVIPLFMLMGEFIGRSGAINDIYGAINRRLRRVPGRLAVATILGNAVFSFVTGVSIASAAAFSRISYPGMKALGYHKGFALGVVAGSSCLGMLIPPSVLMIVWGILTDQSIGRLFIAGILPGLVLTTLFVGYVVLVAVFSPKTVGEAARGTAPLPPETPTAAEARATIVSSLGICFIVLIVLGGIWAGLYTPTEAAGIGAIAGLVLAFIKGVRLDGVISAILSVGRTLAPILLLLFTAALYSRTLAMTGLTNAVQDLFLNSPLGPWGIFAIMVLIWFVLGMLIDSISIMLLTVPIFAPIAMTLGFDPIAFGIAGILAIEAGLLTPPFGILVFTVKAAVRDDSVSVLEIFRAAIPYWFLILGTMLLIMIYPGIATYLPSLAFQ